MRTLAKLLLFIPRLIWRILWSFIKGILLIAVVVALLLVYANNSESQFAKDINTYWQRAQNFYHSRAGQDTSKMVSDLLTDNFERQSSASWSTNQASIYIETSNETFVSAYQDAIDNWNQTGAFTFVLTDNRDTADIVATENEDATSSAAGLAETQVNQLTNQMAHVTVYLNTYYLLNPDYQYSYDRIVHTAEHELGHAIGLNHDDDETSVMQSAGSYYGIQATDIAAVNTLYQDKGVPSH